MKNQPPEKPSPERKQETEKLKFKTTPKSELR
jgi:hypothetical protein